MCDEEYVPAWKRVEEANETQKAAWGMSARAILNRHNCALNIPYMVSVICHDAGVKLENYGKVSLQVQRFLRESPDFKLTGGKFGGIHLSETVILSQCRSCTTTNEKFLTDCCEAPDWHRLPDLQAKAEVRLGCPPTPIMVVPTMRADKVEVPPMAVDNYTCGCGNSKLNDKTDRSCWKCGAVVKS